MSALDRLGRVPWTFVLCYLALFAAAAYAMGGTT